MCNEPRLRKNLGMVSIFISKETSYLKTLVGINLYENYRNY
jgi:hypothetical protein